MSEPTPIHPIRQRLIDDMTLRGFAPLTQKSYSRVVRNCLAHAQKLPKDLQVDDARAYLLHLQQSGVGVSSINTSSVALRFFLRVTLGRGEHVERVPVIREPKRLPPVLSPDEVARLLLCAPSLKWRAALGVAYGAGLRAAEVCNLRIADVDAEEMRIRVEQGKRRKDRYAKLSPSRGHIKIYSEIGTGTVVRMYLPRADRVADKESLAATSIADLEGGERILLVEDDDLVRTHAESVLLSLGYDVTTAANGPAALAILEQGVTFDLLFTDVVMPGGMTGRVLAERARQIWPQLKVLYTSGYTENSIVHNGRLDEGVMLLSKPYSRRQLAQLVRDALS